MPKGDFMKKIGIALLLTLCAVSMAAVFTGCGNAFHVHSYDKQVVNEEYFASPATYTAKAKYYYSCECGEKGHKTFDYGDFLVKSGISFKNFVVDEENYAHIKVANDVTTYSFIKEIIVNGNATYSVSLDVYGLITIPTKTVLLEEGDNTFYILQTIGEELTLYTLTIRRRPIYTVSFNSNGGTEVENQNIEEDSFAVEPQSPKKVAHVFCGWNYDFTRAITANLNLSASWTFDKRLNQFDYTLTDKTCEIVDVKDKTIESVEIPEYVTSIDTQAFKGCDYLSKIYIDSVESWCKISGLENLMSYGLSKELYLNGKELTEFIIPDSITCIGDCMFRKCHKLTSISIPDGIISVAKSSFFGCDSLKYNEYNNALYLGNSGNPYVVLMKAKKSGISSCEVNVKTSIIADGAFSGCGNLTSITIGNKVISIGTNAFFCCKGLTSISIPDSVTYIGKNAFYGCSSLASVFLGKRVAYIGENAFYACETLSDISIPDSIEFIGDYAFWVCSNLKYNEYDNAYYLGNSNTPYLVLINVKKPSVSSCIINNRTKIIQDGAFV